MPDDKFNALMERCKAAVMNEGKGEWLYTDDWGKTKISYKIGKDTRARWTYMRFKSLPQGIDELARGLGINEFVLRTQTCRTKEDGSDYDSYRQTMPQDLAERGERRDFRDDRGPRRGGYGGGGYGGRGGYGDDRGGYGGRDSGDVMAPSAGGANDEDSSN